MKKTYFVLSILVFVLLQACGSMSEDQTLINDSFYDQIENLISSYERGEIAFMDFSTISDPKWDRLYVASTPGYPDFLYTYNVLKEYGAVNVCKPGDNASDSGVSYLMFFLNEKIIGCAGTFNYPYDFSNLGKYDAGLSVNEAIFVIDKKNRIILLQ